MSQRYFIELAYDGTQYHGWQVQPNAKTIQETLNTGLSTILRQEIYTVGCGRTDTGVHATQFYAHFEMDGVNSNMEDLCYQANQILPKDIAVYRIFPVEADVHARFTATARKYHYRVSRRKDPFEVNRAWEVRDELDIDLMNKAAACLFDYEDFTSFSKSNTQTETNLCNITAAMWREEGNVWTFEIEANRFLRNMVRAIVGTLVDVGRHKISIADFKQVIEAKDRSKAGLSVPAEGLYLVNIQYPQEAFNGRQ